MVCVFMSKPKKTIIEILFFGELFCRSVSASTSGIKTPGIKTPQNLYPTITRSLLVHRHSSMFIVCAAASIYLDYAISNKLRANTSTYRNMLRYVCLRQSAMCWAPVETQLPSNNRLQNQCRKPTY